ncbi:MAG: phosphotransferase [Bdellovibrionota bacterium]
MYRQALEMLFCLQRCTGPEKFSLSEQLKHAPHWTWVFDFDKLNSEIFHTERFFCSGLLKENFPLASCLAENAEYLAARPRVLCHRDFHSRNLLVKGDQLFAIDFQDARMGPITYDLVSLLWDPYAYLKEDFRQTLLSEWKEKTLLPGEDATSIDEEIHRMKIQRLLKAIGNYSSFYLDKKNPSCFPYIEAALADTLSSYRALADSVGLGKGDKKAQLWLERVYKKVIAQ